MTAPVTGSIARINAIVKSIDSDEPTITSILESRSLPQRLHVGGLP